jgi:Tfp pilus assembly protein PilN
VRELEFLPDWYPMLRRKRRILVLETWCGVMIAAILCLWIVVSARDVSARQTLLGTRQGELRQTDSDLQKLNELESLKRQMSDQARLVAHLGPHLPIGRLIDDLEKKMPKEMALLDVSLEFQQQNKPQIGRPVAGADPIIDRQINVQLHGVAPSDVVLGNFMIQLATIPRFLGSSLSTADLHQDGRLMREFRISFSLNLNDTDN